MSEDADIILPRYTSGVSVRLFQQTLHLIAQAFRQLLNQLSVQDIRHQIEVELNRIEQLRIELVQNLFRSVKKPTISEADVIVARPKSVLALRQRQLSEAESGGLINCSSLLSLATSEDNISGVTPLGISRSCRDGVKVRCEYFGPPFTPGYDVSFPGIKRRLAPASSTSSGCSACCSDNYEYYEERCATLEKQVELLRNRLKSLTGKGGDSILNLKLPAVVSSNAPPPPAPPPPPLSHFMPKLQDLPLLAICRDKSSTSSFSTPKNAMKSLKRLSSGGGYGNKSSSKKTHSVSSASRKKATPITDEQPGVVLLSERSLMQNVLDDLKSKRVTLKPVFSRSSGSSPRRHSLATFQRRRLNGDADPSSSSGNQSDHQTLIQRALNKKFASLRRRRHNSRPSLPVVIPNSNVVVGKHKNDDGPLKLSYIENEKAQSRRKSSSNSSTIQIIGSPATKRPACNNYDQEEEDDEEDLWTTNSSSSDEDDLMSESQFSTPDRRLANSTFDKLPISNFN